MSLQFIAGPAGSGKTLCMDRMIVERAGAYPDRNFLILVPEQFNMQTQRDIVLASPNKGIMNIDVLSFHRLSHRIFDEAGAGTGTVLDDAAKVMVLRHLSGIYGSELAAFSGRLDKEGYLSEIKSVISEFMQYDIYPSDLDRLCEEQSLLGSKLKDIRFLYRKFIDYLGQEYITTEEILDRAIAVSHMAPFLENAEIYLDGYTGFTPVQLRFLEAMLKKVKRAVVTVTIDVRSLAGTGDKVYFGKKADDTDVFALGKNTVYDLTRLAKNVDSSPDFIEDSVILVSKPVYRLSSSPALAYLSENLFSDSPEKLTESAKNGVLEDVIIYRAGNIREEAGMVCREIRRLTDSGKAGYKDIAVITGGLDEYEDKLMTAMVKYDIPVFFDLRRKVRMNPLTELLESLVELFVRDFSYQSVVRFLRCGLSGIPGEEVQEFENYILASGIRGRNRYIVEWEKVPSGFTQEALPAVNSIRERFITAFEPLFGIFAPRKKSGCMDMAKALYEFLESLGVYEKLSAMSEEFEEKGDKPHADEYRQIYERLMEVLDALTEFLGDEMLTTKELGTLIRDALGELSVGVLPPGTDRVIVGDISRSRVGEVKYLFMMGVNEGLIPPAEKRGGILSDHDREFLRGEGITLSAGVRQQAFIQRFYLYMNLSKASGGLRLSFSTQGSDDSPRTHSYLIDKILKLFKGTLKVRDVPQPSFDDVLTKREGLEILAGNMRDPVYRRETEALIGDYGADEGCGPLIRNMIDLAFRVYEGGSLGASAAAALYGRHIAGSVTRLENFAKCAYSHFLIYGLRLRERYENSFESRDLGVIYHRVLKDYSDLLTRRGQTWVSVSDEERQEVLGEVLDTVLSPGQMKGALYDTARTSYMAGRIRRVMERTVSVLTYQIKKGDFCPEGFEMDFTLSGFRGVIDRIDVYESNGCMYLRIVDYKSSPHVLDITELYEGISLQLCAYGLAASEQYRRKSAGPVSLAGLLYYHIDDPVIDRPQGEGADEALPWQPLGEGGDAADTDAMIRQELIMRGYSDLGVLSHIDRDINPKSDVIKVKTTKGGQPWAGSEVLTAADLDYLTRFAGEKMKELTERIISGEIKKEPVRQGRGENAKVPCRFCRYISVCGFDTRIEGCVYRDIAKQDSEEILEKILERFKGE